MSVNLNLGFDRYGGDPVLCFERHRLDWTSDGLFERMKLEAIPLPNGADWYCDQGLEHYKEDPYGDPLTWLTAHTLVRLLSAVPLHGWDMATLAFLKALPPSTRVVLWWG